MFVATLVLTVIGGLLGLGLGVAARVFAVSDEDPLLKEVQALMPGSQCGQCGFPGCSAAASALVEGTAKVTCCPPGGMALAQTLAELLGLPMDAEGMAAPQMARIAAERCTGCTRCYRACPTDAIVGANGQIHTVLKDACTGCGECLSACPEDCISFAPQGVSLGNWHWDKPQAA
jgi:electron transport complex protein RnfB